MSGENKTIVLINDEEDSQIGLRYIIETVASWDVIGYETEKEVNTDITNGKILPDLIISEYYMKNSTTLEFCRKIRAHYDQQTLPIVSMSWGYLGMADKGEMERIIAELLDAGVNEVFDKRPFEPQDIIDLVKKYL